MKHLNEAAEKLLDLSKTERIEKIRAARWIGYPIAKKALALTSDIASLLFAKIIN